MKLQSNLGRYRAILYSEQEQFTQLAKTLNYRGIHFTERPAFHIGELAPSKPPYSLTQTAVKSILTNKGYLEGFNRYMRKINLPPIVTFSRNLNGNTAIFGWRHNQPTPYRLSRYQRRSNRRKTAVKAFWRQNRLGFIERLSPDVLTSDRLERRTAGLVTPETAKASYLFAGLGSVGSQLAGLLVNTKWSRMHLIDPDVLTLENIKRHLLGVSSTGRFKVTAMRDYLLDKNPLANVEVDSSPLSVVVPGFDTLNNYDYLFLCTGNHNTELWLDGARRAGQITRPLFFVWVEPHMAGGHCLYLRPDSSMSLEDLYLEGRYRFNIIAAAEHERRSFTKREAGCQTTFVPYDNGSLMAFLTKLYSETLTVLSNPDHPSCRFTWTGDLASLDTLGIEMTPSNAEAFSLQKFDL